jgi:hypothetical protein
MQRPSCFLKGVLIWLCCCAATAASANDTDAERYRCGGQVEAQAWSVWDGGIRHYVEHDLLQVRLKEQGDVYALYDFQTYVHNLVSMARRCGRMSRLRDISQLIGVAYGSLEPGGFFSSGRRWVCRGGKICNNTNRLLNTEVMLDSVQFLGLASSVANALATSGKTLTPSDRKFIDDTTNIILEHLQRWGDRHAIREALKAADATQADVSEISSPIFTDKQLWMIAIYAELAGILQSQEQAGAARKFSRLREHLIALLHLFDKRVSIRSVGGKRNGDVKVADIDRGFWRLHPDNRYAGYDGEEKPVRCTPEASGESGESGARPKYDIPPSAATRRSDTGWDLSHARRLVHALDALSRNRKAMQSVFAIADRDMPPADLPQLFANNLVDVMWNKDTVMPLFSNFWSGANGWFRVAYDNGTGECDEGSPPYGMSDAFATGGYVSWARYRHEIGELGKSLYALINDTDGASPAAIARHYSSLINRGDEAAWQRARIAFLPSLVGVGID